MPTRAELPHQNVAFSESDSWTDALPVCRESAVGHSINQIYREDGNRQEAHPYEDFSCHVKVDHDKERSTYLYCLFDGNEGPQAANFALQRMAAEILLDSQLLEATADEEVKGILRQAFLAVESGYWDSVGDKLAERASVQCEIPDDLTSYEAYQKYPHLVDKLNALNTELSSGTSAVIALIRNGKLYVANVGDSRALLCKTDVNGTLKVVQLSVDHDLRNEDELLRMYKLGLDIEKIRQRSRIGNQETTRCIGNYLVKGGFKDFEDLAAATGEPVMAEPDVFGGIVLDETCRFLLLMSDGLYKSLQEATGSSETVNKEIVEMTVEQFKIQSTLTGVAQGVVDKIVRIHHDLFMSDSSVISSGKRDDMTLLVRNFNFPMPNALRNLTGGAQVRFNPIVSTASIARDEEPVEEENVTEMAINEDERNTQDTSTTDSSDAYPETNTMPRRNERIKAYVDFTEFYENFEKAKATNSLPPSLRPKD